MKANNKYLVIIVPLDDKDDWKSVAKIELYTEKPFPKGDSSARIIWEILDQAIKEGKL